MENIIGIGLDCGTMHFLCNRSDKDNVTITRNVFLKIDNDISINKLSDINYIKNEDGEIFIIGSDAFEFANIFGQKVSRPMEKGLISSNEIDAIDILALIIKNTIGNDIINKKDIICSYSIPAESIDSDRSVTYHKNVFGKILGSLGIKYAAVNEAMAVIYSECAKNRFSGIGISFGAGMTNIAVSYKGVEALSFSTTRGGDWIDNMVSIDLNTLPNRVANIKEKIFNLDGKIKTKNKKQKRIVEALRYYHEALIDYTVKKIGKEFEDKVNIEIDDKLPIVISGGTSIPKGFLELFKTYIGKYELPFEILDIRKAKNPLTAVVDGLLVKTLSDIKKMNGLENG